MANDNRGNYGNTQQHRDAGELGGKASSQNQDMSNLGQQGGEAAQRSGNAHELNKEERSEGGQH